MDRVAQIIYCYNYNVNDVGDDDDDSDDDDRRITTQSRTRGVRGRDSSAPPIRTEHHTPII